MLKWLLPLVLAPWISITFAETKARIIAPGVTVLGSTPNPSPSLSPLARTPSPVPTVKALPLEKSLDAAESDVQELIQHQKAQKKAIEPIQQLNPITAFSGGTPSPNEVLIPLERAKEFFTDPLVHLSLSLAADTNFSKSIRIVIHHPQLKTILGIEIAVVVLIWIFLRWKKRRTVGFFKKLCLNIGCATLALGFVVVIPVLFIGKPYLSAGMALIRILKDEISEPGGDMDKTLKIIKGSKD